MPILEVNQLTHQFKNQLAVNQLILSIAEGGILG